MDVLRMYARVATYSLALVSMVGTGGCSHSKSAESSEASRSSAEGSSSSKDSSSSSSGREYPDHPEVEDLRADTKRFRAKAEILELKNTIQSHYVLSDAKTLPDELSELTRGDNPPISEPRSLRDPWGTRYIYRNDGKEGIELFSAGPDGEPGTGDDVRPEQ